MPLASAQERQDWMRGDLTSTLQSRETSTQCQNPGEKVRDFNHASLLL
jgi:hypothetical protein